ncbi:nuclease-related domain-containing protein [Bacillus sp. JJ1122]|uniref:nuclease-related domain-containing protein n=1 Tax=Bacillus sp. JJ1122 TaxID=3122951 RepID=UPI003000ED49
MIAKKRTIPLEILIYEAVVRRLPDRHPRKSEFEAKLIRRRSGFKGEKELDYYLSQLPDDDFTIIQSIRLPHKDTHFQIDTLLLSPCFIVNMEAKNHAGEIEFNTEFDQMIQRFDGSTKVYSSPVLQAKIQTSHLHTLLSKNHFPSSPLEYFVTISNPQTLILNPGRSQEVAYRVCRTARIPYKISDLRSKYKNVNWSGKDIKKITKLLLKKHEPLIPAVSAMNIPIKDLNLGIQCPRCSALGMERIHGNWYCKSCSHTSKDAHTAAIKDYFLLYGNTLSNKQLRVFLQVNSDDFATHLLKSLNLISTGTTRNRLYHPPKDFFN